MIETPRSRRLGNGFAVAGLALLVAGCAASSGLSAGGSDEAPPAEGIGRFEVSSAAVSRGVIVPVRCSSGDTEQFLGGDLFDDELGLAVRLVVDPLYGPALRVYDSRAPFERSVLFFEEECEKFDMSLEPTGEEVNSVIVRNLELDVDCENEDGATIYGHAAARCD